MRRHDQRRKVERIRLFPPIDGQVNGEFDVQLEEVSLLGARIRHYTPFDPQHEISLSFHWQDKAIDIDCEVVRSYAEPFGALVVYHSGIRFLSSIGSSVFHIHQLISEQIEEVLQQQVANATGKSNYALVDSEALSSLLPAAEDRARMRIAADRDEGYARYCYVNGRWERTQTWDPSQPDNGFTIWMFEEDEQVEELCRLYATSDATVRSMIRMCAELSLFVDDGFPPQSFAL